MSARGNRSAKLNFGVLPLLGTMTLKGNTLDAASGDTRIAAIRQQRMMTAVLRGYCMMTVWSPLSISFAVTQVAVPGIAWWRLLPLQLGLSILLTGAGLADGPPRLCRGPGAPHHRRP